jgi:predicted  nucleic acid-binding Zn-ribbon protein
MRFFTDDEKSAKTATRLVCTGCRDEEDKHILGLSRIPDGIFRCDDCGRAFLVYDGRVFVEAL